MSTKLEMVDAAGGHTEEPASDDAQTLLASILTRNVGDRAPGTVVGVLVGFGGSGRPLVSYQADRESKVVEARSCVPVGTDRIGREVVLLFVNAGGETPIIMGIVQDDLDLKKLHRPTNEPLHENVHDVESDGERLIITSEREIVLRCGQASITLTREGKLLLRGAYVSSRSSGVNRIKGGSVEIN
jgi:Domain of unknown function (DUF6484)